LAVSRQSRIGPPASGAGFQPAAGASSPASDRGQDARSGRLEACPTTDRLVPSLLAWFARHARDLPWRHTLDPYAIWVSEIMLQQTQVKTAIPYWDRWLRELPNARALADAPPDKVLKLWEGLGYYTRARNLQKAAQQIVREQRGKFPTAVEDILALPGVGRYTAGAIASIAFNQPAPILDGNVIRVLTRLFGIGEDPREKKTNARLWSLAESLVHTAARGRKQFSILNFQFSIAGSCSALNQSLMELGALVCTPRQPRCEDCPVRRHCQARKTGSVEKLPNLGKRAPTAALRFAAFLVEHKGRWLVQQRPAGFVNAHLWEFPNLEVSAKATLVEAATRFFGRKARRLAPLATVKHSITRYRISLEACLAMLQGKLPVHEPARWLTLPELEHLPFTSAHRKVLQALRRHLSPGAS
jgi:A/G-specific adenine glycosylase